MRISIAGSVSAQARSLLWNRNRNADCDVVPARFVARGLPVVVRAVRADAVQQTTLLESPVQERLAGEEVIGEFVEIPGGQFAERLRVGLVVAPVSRQGEGDLQIAPALLAPVARLLDFPRGGDQGADQRIPEQFAANRR